MAYSAFISQIKLNEVDFDRFIRYEEEVRAEYPDL